MKKILFDANTPYQLLVAILVQRVYYRDDYTIIIISGYLRQYFENLRDSNIFNETHLIWEQPLSVEEIHALTSEFLKQQIDVFHFASYSTVYSCYLFNRLPLTTKIILNDEGIATYDIFDRYPEFLMIFPKHRFEVVNLDRINEIWMFDHAYFNAPKEKTKVLRSIDLYGILGVPSERKLCIDTLNFVFGYTYEPIQTNLFFSQNFLAFPGMRKENMIDLLQKLYDAYRGQLCIYLHPFDKEKEMYVNLGFNIIENTMAVPWEIVLLNQIEQENKELEKIDLMSISSTALAATSMMLKEIPISLNYILLYRLFNTPFDKYFSHFYEKLLLTEKGSHYKIPADFNELLKS